MNICEYIGEQAICFLLSDFFQEELEELHFSHSLSFQQHCIGRHFAESVSSGGLSSYLLSLLAKHKYFSQDINAGENMKMHTEQSLKNIKGFTQAESRRE